LAKEVNANVPNGTALVDIQVTDRNAARAADLANAISYQLIAVVNQYETSAAGSSPVKLTITEPATVPASPVSPKPVLNLILGALIGVILGIGAALLRDAMDTRLASAEETEGIAGAPLLGAIPRERRGAKKHLMVNGPRSWIEAFGLLRTNLQFVEVVNEPHSVVVTSANPGEGKTTIACNLAISLAQVGIRTVLLDGDLRRPAIAEYMNLPNATGLTNVLVRQASLEQALQTWQGGGDIPLRVLTSGPLPPNPSQLVGSSAMAGVIEELESSADVVIIDAPPILTVSDAAALAASADGALLLVRPNHTRREQLQGAVRALAAVGSPLLGITLNMTARMGNYGVYSYYEYTQSQARRSPRQPSSVE
jgi:capsular exopolysaccharide synthesis family protein